MISPLENLIQLQQQKSSTNKMNSNLKRNLSEDLIETEEKRFLKAATEGQTDWILQLIDDSGGDEDRRKQLHNYKDECGRTALHLAAALGHLETVTALTLNGAEVTAQDFTGHTALQRASADGHFEVVKHLLSRGSPIDHQDEVHGNTALHEAAWKGFSRTVELLCMKNKSNYYLRNRGGFSPLHLCCQNGHNETCRVLLRAGCKPNIKNNYGDTPLHTGARYGHAGVSRILISAKCNVNLQNKNGDTPLHIAAAMGRRKLVRILLESGTCDIGLLNMQKESCIDISERKNHADIADIIRNPPPPLIQPEVHPIDAMFPPPLEDERSVMSNKRNQNKKNSKSKLPKGVIGSPYGCHDFPDIAEFPAPDPETLPDDPLKPGEQYYLDLAGNIRKGPAAAQASSCHCGPLLNRVEKKMNRNKREVFKALDTTHGKLANRISHLEKKTKDQLWSLSNTMKETFAQERVECTDRMERRAIRDRIAHEKHADLRDSILRGDLATWIEKRIAEINKLKTEAENGGLEHIDSEAEQAVMMRTLIRGSKRRRKSFLSELQNGTLRRAASEDYLPGTNEDSPNNNIDLFAGGIIVDGLAGSLTPPNELHVSDFPYNQRNQRMRRNSTGNENEIDFVQQRVEPPSLSPPILLDGSLLNSPPQSGANFPQQPNFNTQDLAYSTHSDYTSGAEGTGGRGSITSQHNSTGNSLGSPALGLQHSHQMALGIQSLQRPIPLMQPQQQPETSKPAPPAVPPKPRVSLDMLQQQGAVMQQQQMPNLKQPLLPPKQIQPPPYRPPPFSYNGGGQQQNSLPPMNFHNHPVIPPRGMLHPSETLSMMVGVNPNPSDANPDSGSYFAQRSLVQPHHHYTSYSTGGLPGPGSGSSSSGSKTVSDGGGSHDSHNDSGYYARPGAGSGNSSGPSPSLSGSNGRPDSRAAVGISGAAAVSSQPQNLVKDFNSPELPTRKESSSGLSGKLRQLQQKLSGTSISAKQQQTQAQSGQKPEPPHGSLV